jgi:uncharacterized pyridoxamine 5'-phosphate oxidase family protein
MANSFSHVASELIALKQKSGILCSIAADGKPQATPIYFSAEADLSIYFITHTTSRKYQNMIKHPDVAFVVYTEKPAKCVQIEGTVAPVTDPSEKRIHSTELLSISTEDSENPPIAQIAGKEIVVMKITPFAARFANFDEKRTGDPYYKVK